MQVYLSLALIILTHWFVNALPLDTVQVNNYENALNSDSYRFSYELSDDSSRYEEGNLIEKNGVKFYKVSGFYKYRGTDGKIYLVNYSSDDSGYKSSIEILDTPPSGSIGFEPSLDANAIKSLLG